ncbi:MAG: hypothetical protein QM803_18930 [Rhodocyclaceae bacterium]
MGALHAGRCFASVSDAASAYWSGVGPVVSSGSPPILSTVERDGEGWLLVARQGGAVLSSVGVPSVQFAECNPGDAFIDGVTLGWAVAGVWAAVWGVMYLRRVWGR